MAYERREFTLENATLTWRNFRGEEGRFNPAGTRTFGVIIPSDVAQAMLAEGWNLKESQPREEGDEPYFYMSVEARYGHRPPKIVMISSVSGAITYMTQELVETLDYAEIENVDLIVNGNPWPADTRDGGLKAFLDTMYVTVVPNALDAKYEHLTSKGGAQNESS